MSLCYKLGHTRCARDGGSDANGTKRDTGYSLSREPEILWRGALGFESLRRVVLQ